MNPQTFVFIGRSGCGKGTQLDLLKKFIKEKDPEKEVITFETGAKFREVFEGQNYSSKLSREIYDVGGLQPEFLAVRNWANMLFDNIKGGDEHMMFDGICRRILETEIFTTAMEFYKRNPVVIYVNVSRKWSKDRLLARGREDDTDEGIDKRLDWFDENTMPSIEYLKNNNRYTFIDINGEQTIEDVHKEIMEKLGWA